MAQRHRCPSKPVGLNSYSGYAGKIFTGVSLGSQSDVYRKCEDAGQWDVSGCSGGSGGMAAGFLVSHSAVLCARFCHWKERRVGVAWARARVF
jgi:hypothetical protein